MKHKRPPNVQNNPRRGARAESNAGGFTKPNFKLNYRDIVTKTITVVAQKQTCRPVK
jgi:ribosomal protein L44E